MREFLQSLLGRFNMRKKNTQKYSIISTISLIVFNIFSLILLYAHNDLLALLTMFFGVMFWSGSQVLIRDKKLIHADVCFMFFLFIYSVATPFSILVNGGVLHDNIYVFQALILCFLAILGLSLGILFHFMLLGQESYKNISLDFGSRLYFIRLRRAGYFLFWFGLLSSFVAIYYTVGLSVYLDAGYAGRALLKRDAGPVELGLYISIIGLAFVFSSVVSFKELNKDKIFVYLSIALFICYISFLGIRRPTFLLVVSIFAIYSVTSNSLKLKYAVPGLILFFVGLGMFANYRQVLASDGLGSTLDFVSENYSAEWWDFSKTELGAPFQTLVTALGSWVNESPLYGRSYLDIFIYIFPSFINGGYQTLSMEYTHRFFSSEFIGIGGNMGFFPVTEALLNFGVAGVFFVFFIFALILRSINKYMYSGGKGALFKVVFCSILIPWFAFFIRLDFSSFLKGFVYSQLLAIIFVYLYLHSKRR